VLLNQKKINGGRSDDYFDSGIKFSGIDGFDKALGAGKEPI
jgi:hypothetical protein